MNPSFLTWIAFQIMVSLAEKISRGETVLEVAIGTKMNSILDRLILSAYGTFDSSGSLTLRIGILGVQLGCQSVFVNHQHVDNN